MLDSRIFKALGDLVVTARSRRDAEHREFMAFYRDLVETLPTEVLEAFGSVAAPATIKGEACNYRLELNATDYIWWKKEIEEKGARFTAGPSSIQLDILTRLAKTAEDQRLQPAERKALLALLDDARPGQAA